MRDVAKDKNTKKKILAAENDEKQEIRSASITAAILITRL